MPTPRSANCILCDDVRHEVGNKISLMGIYTSDIIFSTPPPVTFRTLGLVTWLIFDIDDRPAHLTVRVLVPPERTEALRIEADVERELSPKYERDEYSRGTLRIVGMIDGLQFTEAGFLEVMIDTERETFRAGRIRIW